MTEQSKSPLAALVGKYFLAWRDAEPEWQGRVVEAYGTTHVMVLLFDWAWGLAGDRKLVPLAETAGWTFYDTARDMRFASWKVHSAQGLCEGTFEEDEAVHERLAYMIANS